MIRSPMSLFEDHFFNPRNVGTLGDGAIRGHAGSLTCGAAIEFYLVIDESQIITDIEFKAAGCSVLVAAASLFTEAVKGLKSGEAAALARTPKDEFLQLLSDRSIDRADCLKLAGQALLAAITDYSDSARHDWEGEDVLICTCFCVSERTIQREIEKKELHSINEVTRECSAGAGCRSCWPLIEDMLATIR